jgi:hypothetical protein
MKHPLITVALPLLAALLTACATTGTGTGSTASGAGPVSFNWTSSDGVSGTMSAAFQNGTVYTGQFFQITSDTRIDSVGPLWSGGHPGWFGRGGWEYWDVAPTPGFITHYSGRVVANLSAPSGQHMRCSFQLAHPSSGLSGGGQGRCQMPDAKTIDATFPVA